MIIRTIILNYVSGVHKYLAHQHRQGQTLGAALFHKVLFNRNSLRLFKNLWTAHGVCLLPLNAYLTAG